MTGLDQHAVLQAQLAEQDPLALPGRAQAQARGRQQVDQLRGGGGSAFAGAAFKIAPGQQEQGKHAHRVEVQLAAAGDRGPDPGAVGQADGQ
ncbi:hypothetical protein D3C81_1565420 [compost metagenome]